MSNTPNFTDSTVLVTGGTGSFGTTMIRHLLSLDVGEVRVLSRDENKQDLLRRKYADERLRFFIGDVRDSVSVDRCIPGVDYVFHSAALKQVPSCEFFPSEAVKTNVIGSENVVSSSVRAGVKAIVCLSTDKAVYPINAMGMSKALMERVVQSFARDPKNSHTRIAITRYGNVMMSRGSVIPLFRELIRAGKPITMTNPNMTRFLMSLDDSVDLVKYAFLNADSGDILIKKAPACTIETLATAIAHIEGVPHHPTRIIGIRHGEKQHEVLVSSEEMNSAFDYGGYYKVPIDSRGLDYQLYFSEGKQPNEEPLEFSSKVTKRLNLQEVIDMVRSLPEYTNTHT